MTRWNRKTVATGLATALTFDASAVITVAPAIACGRTPAVSWTADASNPDAGAVAGAYNSLAEYIRSIEGTPCGVDCTREMELERHIQSHR
jgi:hypothetical protein